MILHHKASNELSPKLKIHGNRMAFSPFVCSFSASNKTAVNFCSTFSITVVILGGEKLTTSESTLWLGIEPKWNRPLCILISCFARTRVMKGKLPCAQLHLLALPLVVHLVFVRHPTHHDSKRKQKQHKFILCQTKRLL